FLYECGHLTSVVRVSEFEDSPFLNTTTPFIQGMLNCGAEQADKANTNGGNEAVVLVALASMGVEIFIPYKIINFHSLEVSTQLLFSVRARSVSIRAKTSRCDCINCLPHVSLLDKGTGHGQGAIEQSQQF